MFNCSYWLVISLLRCRGHAKPRPHTAIRCAQSALLLPPGRIPWQFLCVSECVCVKWVCVSPLYLPIGNVRNCNFSFYCCGIIKWREYLMQLNANYVWKWVCVFNGFLWLPTWHAQLLTVDALPSQQPNHAHPIMEPRLRLPRLNKLGRHKHRSPFLPPEKWNTHTTFTFKQYNADCGRASHWILIDWQVSGRRG